MESFSFEGFNILDAIEMAEGGDKDAVPGALSFSPILTSGNVRHGEGEPNSHSAGGSEMGEREGGADRMERLEVMVAGLAESVTQMVNIMNDGQKPKADTVDRKPYRAESGWLVKSSDKVPEFDGTKPLGFSNWRKALIRYFSRNPWMNENDKISVLEASLKGIARDDADKLLDSEKINVEIFLHTLGKLYKFPDERERHLEVFRGIRFTPERGIQIFSNDLRASFVEAYPLQDYKISEVLKDAFIAGVPEGVARELRKLPLEQDFEEWVEVANKAYKAIGMKGGSIGLGESEKGMGLTQPMEPRSNIKKSGNGQGRW